MGCKSGGHRFGTWFAYGASYSNSGFVFVDRREIRHLFVCMVSSKHVVLDNATMRVVGEGCAYPLWLLTYCVTRSSSTVRAASAPAPKSSKPTSSASKRFYVVKNGSWVLE